ncbi:MAG: flagellar FliJ family protein [Myxococcota bacterium]
MKRSTFKLYDRLCAIREVNAEQEVARVRAELHQANSDITDARAGLERLDATRTEMMGGGVAGSVVALLAAERSGRARAVDEEERAHHDARKNLDAALGQMREAKQQVARRDRIAKRMRRERQDAIARREQEELDELGTRAQAIKGRS